MIPLFFISLFILFYIIAFGLIQTGAEYDYEPTIREATLQGLQEPIRAETEARTIFPVTNFGDISTMTAYWWKQLEAIPINYDYKPGNVLTSKVTVKQERRDVPVIEAELNYTYDDYLAILKSNLIPIQAQTRIVGTQIAINEDIKLIIGDPGLGITSFADTTNNSTEGGNSGTFADLDKIHARWSEMMDDYDDNMEFALQVPRMMIITRDIAKKCRSVIADSGSTIHIGEAKNGLAYLRHLMATEAPPGSALIVSKYLNGSAAYAEGIPTVTDGALSVVMAGRSKMIFEQLVSQPTIRMDPVSQRTGLWLTLLHRTVNLFKRKEGIIFEGTYTLT